jgi:tetratricopeptide (TPR) repeat protein
VISFKRDSDRTKMELAYALMNWGTSLGRRGQRARAIELKREAVGKLHEVFGFDHYMTGTFQQRLAEELFALDRLDEATAVLDSSISTQEKQATRNYREIGVALRLRGGIQIRQGNLGAAERTLSRARTLLDSMGASRTIPEIGIAAEFAKLFEARNDVAAARREYEHAYALARETVGMTNLMTLSAIGRLAAFEERVGNATKAAALRRDSTAAVQKEK